MAKNQTKPTEEKPEPEKAAEETRERVEALEKAEGVPVVVNPRLITTRLVLGEEVFDRDVPKSVSAERYEELKEYKIRGFQALVKGEK